MSPRLAFGGDVMLAGRIGPALAIGEVPPLLDPAVRALLATADLAVANLECAIVARPPAAPAAGPRYFCAPPQAAEVLRELGIGCVSLANNHAGDAGADGVRETADRLAAVGVLALGVPALGVPALDVPALDGPPLAGQPTDRPRAAAGPGSGTPGVLPGVVLELAGVRVGLLAFSDHPSAAARTASPRPTPAAPTRQAGGAWPLTVDLSDGCPAGLLSAVRRLRSQADAVVVFPHWGPNYSLDPVPAVADAAVHLLDAGADLIVGHSAHVFQGVAGPVCFDLGGLIDDYPRHPLLGVDIGLICIADIDVERGPDDGQGRGAVRSVELHPVVRRAGTTTLAAGQDYQWAGDRLRDACHAWGTEVTDTAGRLAAIGGHPAGAARDAADPGLPRWWR